MSNAIQAINEAKISNVGQLHFELRLTSADGAPIAGRDVRVSLEGDGSLSGTFDAKQVVRETNAEGRARVTWYRRGIFGRDVTAQVSAACADAGAVVTLQRLSPEEVPAPPRTGWVVDSKPSWQR